MLGLHVHIAMVAFCFSLLAVDGTRIPAGPSPLKTVQKVDLARYVGQWYELARYPNRFERDCAADVTANYKTRSDGKIEVVNACRKKDGQLKVSRGNAKVTDTQTNAKLKVTFFWPFYGDYWVIVLDPEYKYAVVGEPARKYLWILSREPALDGATYKKALEQITVSGYDISKLVKTPQNGGVSGSSDD